LIKPPRLIKAIFSLCCFIPCGLIAWEHFRMFN
jgi:hypothetical protein